MIRLMTVSTLALVMSACATDSLPREVAGPAPQNQGTVMLGGISAADALGAIDTAKLTGSKPQTVTANQPTATAIADGSASPKDNAIAVEGVSPAAVLAAIDTSKLVSGAGTKTAIANRSDEVQAIADKKGYTTKQLALAELEAVKK